MKENIDVIPRKNLYTRGELINTFFFWLIWGVVKYLPSPLGDLSRYGVLKVFAKKINSWRVKEGLFLSFPEKISIGRESGINEYCHFDGYGGITIGDHCMIGHHVTLLTRDHEIDEVSGPMRYGAMKVGSVIIGNDVYIGAKVFINRGVRIGDGAVVGAGSVVTHDVDPFTVVCGNPARFIRYRKKR